MKLYIAIHRGGLVGVYDSLDLATKAAERVISNDETGWRPDVSVIEMEVNAVARQEVARFGWDHDLRKVRRVSGDGE